MGWVSIGSCLETCLLIEAAGREDEHGRGEECSGETISIRVFGAQV
jgi:hypothetical protein